MISDSVIPRGDLPPDQAALRDRSLPPNSAWRNFTPQEVNQTIPERLAQIVALYPERLATKDPYRSFTYAELDRAANQVAHAVLRVGGAGHEPVPYLFHVDARRVPAVHGILRTGKSAVPLAAADALERLTFLVQDTGARALVTGHETVTLAESIVPSSCRVIDLDSALVAALPRRSSSRPRPATSPPSSIRQARPDDPKAS